MTQPGFIIYANLIKNLTQKNSYKAKSIHCEFDELDKTHSLSVARRLDEWEKPRVMKIPWLTQKQHKWFRHLKKLVMLSFDWKYPALGIVGKVTRYAISPNWTKPSAAAGMKKQPNRQQQHHHHVTSRERCTLPEKESKYSRISRRVKKNCRLPLEAGEQRGWGNQWLVKQQHCFHKSFVLSLSLSLSIASGLTQQQVR